MKQTIHFAVFRRILEGWYSYYEVLVVRQQNEYVVARVPSRRSAERRIRSISRQIEVSRRAMHWRQVRGLHPWRLVQIALVLLLLTQALPWLWVRAVVSLVCLALIGGLQSSGGRWRQGGIDDR